MVKAPGVPVFNIDPKRRRDYLMDPVFSFSCFLRSDTYRLMLLHRSFCQDHASSPAAAASCALPSSIACRTSSEVISPMNIAAIFAEISIHCSLK